MMTTQKKRGKGELRDYLQERHAATLHKQTELEEERKRLETLMEIVDRIVEIKRK